MGDLAVWVISKIELLPPDTREVVGGGQPGENRAVISLLPLVIYNALRLGYSRGQGREGPVDQERCVLCRFSVAYLIQCIVINSVLTVGLDDKGRVCALNFLYRAAVNLIVDRSYTGARVAGIPILGV